MEFTDLEIAGRFLCKAYYNGSLPSSANCEERSGMWYLARCVEKVLEDTQGRGGRICAIWRALMSGDLAKLNTQRRAALLGGGVKRDALGGEGENWVSIDGRDEDGVRENELLLYTRVGMQFRKLIPR